MKISYYNFSKIALFWIDNPQEIRDADLLTLMEFFLAFVVNIEQINKLSSLMQYKLHITFENVCAVILLDHTQRNSFSDLFDSDCEFDFSGLEVSDE